MSIPGVETPPPPVANRELHPRELEDRDVETAFRRLQRARRPRKPPGVTPRRRAGAGRRRAAAVVRGRRDENEMEKRVEDELTGQIDPLPRSHPTRAF